MWEQLAQVAAVDAGAPGALGHLDSLDVVYCQSWQYDDPVGRLAGRLGADPARRRYSGIGGSVPQSLVAEAATGIVDGDLDLALVVGAEALATVRRAKKQGDELGWSHPPAEKPRFPYDTPVHPSEVSHGIFHAYLSFALFDSARRAHLGRSLDEHRRRLGQLLARLTEVAAADPDHAWFPIARRPEEIVTPTPANRMVAFPYTKLMTSIMDVDMAAALLLASDETADRLGVDPARRVYLRGWAYAEDPPFIAARRDLWRSVAMQAAMTAALDQAGTGAADLAHLDLYSCFASSVGFGVDALGLDEQRFLTGPDSVTVTGGLPYHGGPGSNYMTHSIAAMAERLRSDPGACGLVSGVGMHMCKHVAAVWSTAPGATAPAGPGALQSRVDAALDQSPIAERAEGAATVAACSVLHGRDGEPEWGALVCDLPGGARCYARLHDRDALVEAERTEPIGRRVTLVDAGAGVNVAVPT
jgi:acetyl-CoA C-acetyltransferase